jgi:hypothetical protein
MPSSCMARFQMIGAARMNKSSRPNQIEISLKKSPGFQPVHLGQIACQLTDTFANALKTGRNAFNSSLVT